MNTNPAATAPTTATCVACGLPSSEEFCTRPGCMTSGSGTLVVGHAPGEHLPANGHRDSCAWCPQS